jgi:hypothetical protein
MYSSADQGRPSVIPGVIRRSIRRSIEPARAASHDRRRPPVANSCAPKEVKMNEELLDQVDKADETADELIVEEVTAFEIMLLQSRYDT